MALLAGCGAGHGNLTTTSAQHSRFQLGKAYAVNVVFCSEVDCAANATPREERLVGTRLRDEPCVRQVAFISNARALAMFKKEHPKLVAAMPPGIGNPCPTRTK